MVNLTYDLFTFFSWLMNLLSNVVHWNWYLIKLIRQNDYEVNSCLKNGKDPSQRWTIHESQETTKWFEDSAKRNRNVAANGVRSASQRNESQENKSANYSSYGKILPEFLLALVILFWMETVNKKNILSGGLSEFTIFPLYVYRLILKQIYDKQKGPDNFENECDCI